MTPKSLAAVVVASFLAIASLPLTAENPPEQDVGFVLDLRGDWEIAGAPPVALRVGRSVPANGTIRPRSAQPSSFITIVLFDGSTTMTRSCRNAGECSKPLVLPGLAKPDPFWSRALRTLGALLSRQDEALVPVMARDILTADDEVQAHETVLALSGPSIDLSPVIRGSGAGRYTLVLEPVGTRNHPANARPLTASVEWEPEKPVKVSADNLAPGLYTMTVVPERDDLYVPIGASAWILLTRAEAFDERARAFEEAVELTRGWEKPIRKQAVRRFLRACLEMLAADGGESGRTP